MIEVRSGGLEANVWLGSLPNWAFHVDHMVEHRISAPGQRMPHDIRAAVELFVAAGARAHYGALAVDFTPGDSAHLVMHLPVSSGNEQVIRDSLARNLDIVREGLPQEYAESAFRGLLDVSVAHLIGSGTLRGVGARYGDVGSFTTLFRTLGRILARLVVMQSDKEWSTGLDDALQTMLHEEVAIQRRRINQTPSN